MDVGLIAGDMSKNREAAGIVMMTDILRNNMLYRVISVQLHHIERLSGIRLNMSGFKNLSNETEKKKLAMVLKECLKRNEEQNMQELHPIKHLRINDDSLKAIYAKIE